MIISTILLKKDMNNKILSLKIHAKKVIAEKIHITR